MALDYKKIREEAQAEVDKERAEKAKARIKDKLKALEQAKQVVKNLERELIDLEDELQQNK